MIVAFRRLLILFTVLFLPASLLAQSSDSVTVRGRIKNLTVQLYRQSPTVSIARNNILQATRDLNRSGTLEPDGSFQVTIPLIYPYEEVYFNFGTISTVFLASKGTVEISVDADSLFKTDVPFRFGGTNAQVNNALAQYKAYEFRNRPKINGQQLTERLAGQSMLTSWSVLNDDFSTTYRTYSQTHTLPPLLNRYLRSLIRYEAAAFLYDKAAVEGDAGIASLRDSLRPVNDPFLSVQRIAAMEHFARYASSKIDDPVNGGLSRNQRSVPIQTFAALIDRYVNTMSATERMRVQELKESAGGTSRDLQLLQRLYQRHADTLSQLFFYEASMVQYRKQVDSLGLDFLKANFLAVNLPLITLQKQRLLHDYIAPQVTVRTYRRSLEELYQLEVKDSASIRQVNQRLMAAGSGNAPLEVFSNVFVQPTAGLSGRDVLQRIQQRAQGALSYLLLFPLTPESDRQQATLARQVTQPFSTRDLQVVYLCFDEEGRQDLWQEWLAKNKLPGLHIFVTDNLLNELAAPLRVSNLPAASLMDGDGKYVKRKAPLPSQREELIQLFRKGR